MGRPLGAADKAILELEGSGVVGHTCKLIVLGAGGPGIDALRARISERLGEVAQLRRRLGGSATDPEWIEDQDFELGRHVVGAPAHGRRPLPDAALDRLIEDLFVQPLERDRPLWRMDVARLESGRTAVIWRLHHALADGTTAIRWARRLLWDQADPPPARRTAGSATSHELDELRRHGQLASFVERELTPGQVPALLAGAAGAQRRIGFARIELPAIHDAARRLARATVNDAVLAIVAGAVRSTLGLDGSELQQLRLKVPVSLHHEGDDAANADSFFTVPVPVDIEDPVARLLAIRELTAARKRAHDAEAIAELLERTDGSPESIELAQRLERSAREFALCVSNVPGPPEPVSILDAPVERLATLAEIGRRHGLRVGCISLAGAWLELGICADAGIVDDVGPLVGAIEREAAALIAS